MVRITPVGNSIPDDVSDCLDETPVVVTPLPPASNRGASCFDCETAPLPDDQLRILLPEFEPPPHPGEFNESDVKVGNMKDPAKIKEKIEAARTAHTSDVKNYEKDVEEARASHFDDFKAKAALDATTGRVIVIGFSDEAMGIPLVIGNGEEAEIISEFWKRVVAHATAHIPLIGFNIFGFDLPFLVRRSWLLGIPVPPCVMAGGGKWQSWNTDLFIDVMRAWGFNDRNYYISLDDLGRAMGLGGKAKGEVTGENFWRYWLSEKKENRAKALEYVTRDVDLPLEIAERMGLV